ncbi:MAG: DTW domain-containing protein [Bradymonadia bacterium]
MTRSIVEHFKFLIHLYGHWTTSTRLIHSGVDWLHTLWCFCLSQSEFEKMTRTATHLHCLYCWSPSSHCICDLAHPIENLMPVKIYIHHKELSRRSNSSHLLKLALKNVSFEVHGAPNHTTNWPSAAKAQRSCVLFPSDDAQPLTVQDREQFDQLIIVDGNWRQAKKAANRLKKLPCPHFRTLPFQTPSEFKLRTQSALDRLSTFESVARAMAILEDPNPWELMMPIFRAHVSVTMEQRSRRGLPSKKNLR